MSDEARGWVALMGIDVDDLHGMPFVGVFCPPCAAKEFARPLRDDGYV